MSKIPGMYNDELEINDLIRDAHPYGGTEVVDVPEGLVEDSIESQMKILEMVAREPTLQTLASLADYLDDAGLHKLANSVDSDMAIFAAESSTELSIYRFSASKNERLRSEVIKAFDAYLQAAENMLAVILNGESDFNTWTLDDQVQNLAGRIYDQLLASAEKTKEITNLKSLVRSVKKDISEWVRRFNRLPLDIDGSFFDKNPFDLPRIQAIHSKPYANFEDVANTVLEESSFEVEMGQPTVVDESDRPSSNHQRAKTAPRSRTGDRQAVGAIQKFLVGKGLPVQKGGNALVPDYDWGPTTNSSLNKWVLDTVNSSQASKEDRRKAKKLVELGLLSASHRNVDKLDIIAKVLKSSAGGELSGKLKKKELTHIDFVSPVTGSAVSSFPIIYLLDKLKSGNAESNAINFIEFLKVYDALPGSSGTITNEDWFRLPKQLTKVVQVIGKVLDQESYLRLKSLMVPIQDWVISQAREVRERQEYENRPKRKIIDLLKGIFHPGHRIHRVFNNPSLKDRLLSFLSQDLKLSDSEGNLTAPEGKVRGNMTLIDDWTKKALGD